LSISVDQWVLVEARPGKRIFSGFDRATGDLVFMEEFDDQAALDQAAYQREVADTMTGKDIRNMAVIPESVRARALKEGWYFDEKAWARWMNDPDNNKLRVTGGRA
jgi:hypothetical protein